MRQDQLVLQMFSLMDRLLKDENLDLKLTPYRCVCLPFHLPWSARPAVDLSVYLGLELALYLVCNRLASTTSSKRPVVGL